MVKQIKLILKKRPKIEIFLKQKQTFFSCVNRQIVLITSVVWACLVIPFAQLYYESEDPLVTSEQKNNRNKTKN